MTGKLHNIRHTRVPSNEFSYKLYRTPTGYLDNPCLGEATKNRPSVAEKSPHRTIGKFVWDALEALAILCVGAAIGALAFAYVMARQP